MYETNLSWSILTEILSSLTLHGFIEEVNAPRSIHKRNHKEYRITRKGETAVQYYRNAEQLLKINELDPHKKLIS